MQMIEWLGLVLDAHFHALVFAPSTSIPASVLRPLQRWVASQLRTCDALRGLDTLLAQVTPAGAIAVTGSAHHGGGVPKQPVPDYSIEVYEL
jgi:hypothetical protein